MRRPPLPNRGADRFAATIRSNGPHNETGGNLKEAAAFWDREVVQPKHISWMAHPKVREYINESIAGPPGLWPMDWFVREYESPHFERALSIGCGTGALERDLLVRGVCGSFDAFDGSSVSIEAAKNEAATLGLSDRVNYWVGDFNEPQLPDTKYDAVFFHQSAHHVAKLEKLFRAVLAVLKPDGLVYLDEFVGPSRTDWTDELLAPLREANRSIPDGMRIYDHLPEPIQHDDPSEAIRSSEILPQLRIGFSIDTMRGYGGNLLAVLFEVMREPTEQVVEQLIDAERKLLASGVPPYCAIIVARPKTGLARMIASARYFVEPKVRRILRELNVIRS